MAIKIVTPPTIEPVTLAEAKLRLRIDTTDDDSFLSALIATARQEAEQICSCAFITQTWDFVANKNELNDKTYIEIPRPPLQSVTSITYVDTAGGTQTWASTNYWIDTNGKPGRILLRPSGTWPTSMREIASFIVRFVAGYGSAASDVPEAIREAILRIVTTLYERREDVVVGTIVAKIPMNAQALLMPYKVLYL